ncbi:hypothetical protein AAC387_Pa05g0072 [Persea americana]
MAKLRVSLSLAIFFSLLFSLLSPTQPHPLEKPCNASISAMFVFGDSTVDPGNNNYVPTIFKSNFPPYGRDFIQHKPTGRFTNGRLPTDILASYVCLKETIPPYLDKSLSDNDLLTGVSFASAGSGYDPLTPSLSRVIDMPKQLDYFREYLKMIQLRIGKERTQDLIKKALVVVSAGTNDFVVNYMALPFQQKKYTIEEYQNFLLLNLRQFLQEVRALGVRKIVVVGLPPMGCLPLVITLESHKLGFEIPERGCIDSLNSLSSDYNQKLQDELMALQMHKTSSGSSSSLSLGLRLAYCDIYHPVLDMVQHPAKFGFEETTSGCCGTGLLEASILCNSHSPACSDASKYVFFDSIHPTEKTYSDVLNSLYKTIDDLLKD